MNIINVEGVFLFYTIRKTKTNEDKWKHRYQTYMQFMHIWGITCGMIF